MENGRLRVETLGPLRVFAGEQELAVGPPKQRALFAVLALSANSVVPRDDLIDHLWGDASPATAAGSVHTYLSGLRRALADLGEPLTGAGTGYALRLDPGQLDTAVVEQLVARARSDRARQDPAAAVAALDAALARWRPGTVLGGLPGPFADQHRAWASELRLRLLTERAELLLDLERPAAAAAGLREHVSANPYDERLRGLLMTALRRSGRTADALAQYQDLRKLLADDLGIDPSAELGNLNSAILADSARTVPVPARPAAAPVRPAQLPHGVGGFVGRTAEVQQVLDAARTASADGAAGGTRSPRVVMVVGVGGVGKTALAVHCAHLLAEAFPDGQLYLNLCGFDPKRPARSPADTLHHLLASVNAGPIPDDHEQRVALWRSIVRDKRLLIVLDNAESADRVEDLLPGGGPSFTVVTSRNRLSGLAVRYSARRVTLPPLTADESLALLSASIGADGVGAELPAARRLAELCDHLPLALRIASEQVTAGSQDRIADLVADLEDARHRLDALQIPDDDLYSVRGVLSCSYAGLGSEAAHAFRTLGQFPGAHLRVEAAAALLDVRPSAAAAALRGLAAQHLVEATGSGYRMHDLTHIYAEEMSREVETTVSRRQALERLLTWYLRTLAQEASPGAGLPFALDAGTPHEPLRFGDRKELVAWCAQEWDNLVPLMRTAQRIGCHEQVWQSAYLLFEYCCAAGQAADWVEMLRLGLRSAEMTGDRRAQAVLLGHLGVATSRAGHTGAAADQLRRGLRLLEDTGEDVLRAGLLGNLASALRRAKDYAAALPCAWQALELARRSGLAYYEAGCLGVLCELQADLGEFEESLWLGRLGLAEARRCRSALLEAGILISLGAAEYGLDRPGAALGYYQDALSLCASSGDRYHEALALFGLARVLGTGAARDLAARDTAARDMAARAQRRLRELGAEEVSVTEFLRALDAAVRPAPPPAEASVRRAG